MRVVVLVLLLVGFFAGRGEAAEFLVDRGKSVIAVDVKATAHKFSGTLSKYSLKISGDAATLTPKAVALQWDFVDLLTGDKKRDKNMLKWLEHGTYGTGSFNLTSFSKAADGSQVAEGKLKIHGVSKTIRIPVTTVRSGGTVTVKGEVSIDHRDFKLDKIRTALVMTVNPVLRVHFSLVGSVK